MPKISSIPFLFENDVSGGNSGEVLSSKSNAVKGSEASVPGTRLAELQSMAVRLQGEAHVVSSICELALLECQSLKRKYLVFTL